ncbi:MAG TPA: hypothetical protein VGS19_23135 [Streptosporangiaceae bacterium]|nr:hypothetical protein [Streptosporangiaceae bacterium]
MSNRKCVLLAGVLAAVLAGTGGLVPAASSVAAATGPAALTCGAWSIVASPNVGSADNTLNGVATVSAKNAWAVGSSTNTVTSVASTLTEHWNGTRWRIVPSPNAGSAQNLLQAVAVIPHTNQLWAVGYFISGGGPLQTLAERWDGTDWDVVPSPNVGTGSNSLGAVVALSATDAWAVGASSETPSSSQALIEHWDGTTWSVVSSPTLTGNVNLAGLTAVRSTSQLWASGGTGNATLTEHFDGTSWSVVPSPNAPGSTGGDFLYGTRAVAASNVWAVGSTGSGGNPVLTLTEHWDGTSWSVIPSPNPSAVGNVLFAVAPIPGTTQVWAVGEEGSANPGPFQTLVERWDGTSWSVVTSPDPSPDENLLRSVATRSTEAWAVGSSTTTAGATNTLIEHFC